MDISAALDITLQDFPGEVAAELFTKSCNFCCPHCHAKPVIGGSIKPVREEDFLSYCSASSSWLTGISICGGEPTLQPDLESFLLNVRGLGLKIKVDTNGSKPEVLESLLKKQLADYVAMDIKGPINLWKNITGVNCPAEDMKRSMLIVQHFPRYEFRTTAAPIIRDSGEISFMTAEEIGDTAKFIALYTKNEMHSYFIQKFIPRKNGLLEPKLECFNETPALLLDDMLAEAIKYLPKTQMRG